MKKTTWVAMTLMLTLTGCNTCSNLTRSITGQMRGCFSGLGSCRSSGANNVGAPCDAGCEQAGPNQPCQSCGETANYGSYDGMFGSSEGIVTGVYDGTPGSSISTSPSRVLPSGSYLSNPSSSVIRGGETVSPRPAN